MRRDVDLAAAVEFVLAELVMDANLPPTVEGGPPGTPETSVEGDPVPPPSAPATSQRKRRS